MLTMSVTEAVVDASQNSPHSLIRRFVFGCKPNPRPVRFARTWLL